MNKVKYKYSKIKVMVLVIVLLHFSCEKETKNNNNCIGCNYCEYTNYYILKTIGTKCFKNSIYELRNYDTCLIIDFSIKLFLYGKLVIESSYNEIPSCIERMYFINKVKKIEFSMDDIKFKPKLPGIFEEDKPLGYSPIELKIDTNSVQYSDTVILLSSIISIKDDQGNTYSSFIPKVYIKF